MAGEMAAMTHNLYERDFLGRGAALADEIARIERDGGTVNVWGNSSFAPIYTTRKVEPAEQPAADKATPRLNIIASYWLAAADHTVITLRGDVVDKTITAINQSAAVDAVIAVTQELADAVDSFMEANVQAQTIFQIEKSLVRTLKTQTSAARTALKAVEELSKQARGCEKSLRCATKEARKSWMTLASG